METITIPLFRAGDGRLYGYREIDALVAQGIAVHHTPAGKHTTLYGWSVTHIATGRPVADGLTFAQARTIAARARRWPAWVRLATDLDAIRLWVAKAEGKRERRAVREIEAAA